MSIVEYDMTRLSSNQLESLAISVKNELAARHEKVRRAKADAIIDNRRPEKSSMVLGSRNCET